MGTRSSYRVIETVRDEKRNVKTRENFVLVYVQFDGYPEGHPKDVAKWLSEGKVVNGFSVGNKERVFNGTGCLAAQLIRYLKETLSTDGVGGVYVNPIKSRGNSWEEFLYDIIVDFDEKKIIFKAFESHEKPKLIFEGTPMEFYEKYNQ